MPRQRLPEARSAKYFARMFPGSQPAGMVKQAAGEYGAAGDAGLFLPPAAARRFSPPTALLLAVAGENANQATYRVDPAGRFLYVVFFPEPEKAG